MLQDKTGKNELTSPRSCVRRLTDALASFYGPRLPEMVLYSGFVLWVISAVSLLSRSQCQRSGLPCVARNWAGMKMPGA